MQYGDYVGVDIDDVKQNVLEDNGFWAGWTYFWKNVLVDSTDIDAGLWFTGWFKYQKYTPVTDGSNWYDVVLGWIEDEIVTVAQDIDQANAQREE